MQSKPGVEGFVSTINKLVSTGMSYTDAIVSFCEKNNIEVEAAAGFIKTDATLKAALQREFEDLNMLPKSSRLPL